MLQWAWVCRYLLEILISILLGIYGRSGISDHILNFLRNFHIDFHGTYLYSHEQYMRVPFSLCILINTCGSNLCVLDAGCWSDIRFANICYHCMSVTIVPSSAQSVLPLLIVDSALFCKENFNLDDVQLNLFSLLLLVLLGSLLWLHCQILGCKDVLLCFLLKFL